jgi:hypothetical protein
MGFAVARGCVRNGHIPVRSWESQRFLIGAVAVGIWAFVYFAMLNTMVPGWIFLAIVVSLIPHDMMYGPQAALIAECFSPRLRYTGASLGFHLASLIAGGPAPLIATALLASTGLNVRGTFEVFEAPLPSASIRLSSSPRPVFTGRIRGTGAARFWPK